MTDVASIERILNLNHASQDVSDSHHDPSAANGLIPQSAPILNADGEPIWKALVFDNLGRDVISSVLRVPDLRGWGITLHLYVHLQRMEEACTVAVDAETQAADADSSMSETSTHSGMPYPIFQLYTLSNRLRPTCSSSHKTCRRDSILQPTSTSCPRYRGHYLKNSPLKLPKLEHRRASVKSSTSI